MEKELNKPVFFKTTYNANEQLKRSEELEQEEEGESSGNVKRIDYGVKGEDNIAFQLKNSYMPMYILRDVYFVDEETDTHSQIDFLVFTKKLCFVIESKYFGGKTVINYKGRFIRIKNLDSSQGLIPQGCESPLAQNQRHVDLIKQIRRGKQLFQENYKSVVVFSNYNMILDDKEAPDEVRNNVIRVDELIPYIRAQHAMLDDMELTEEQLEDWANSFVELHEAALAKNQMHNLEEELQEYREKILEEMSKWSVFGKDAVSGIIDAMPGSMNELRAVNGFGKTFTDKYGQDILAIVSKYKKEELT